MANNSSVQIFCVKNTRIGRTLLYTTSFKYVIMARNNGTAYTQNLFE